jgi:hypothetical protein
MDFNRQEVTKSLSYYEILEISDENASVEQIKEQYQKLLLIVSFLNSLYQKYAIGFLIN